MTTPKKRILVVDDDEKITRLVRLNLELTGDFEVREETRADRAVAAVREFRPELILLDLMMPKVDGGELAAKIREFPEFKGVPIVFLTAAVTRQEVRSHAYIGGERFLAKPAAPADLIACVREELETHPRQDQPERKNAPEDSPHFSY